MRFVIQFKIPKKTMTDPEARIALVEGRYNEVVENYMYLAVHIVHQINARNRYHDPQDLLAVALTALTSGVYKAVGHPEPGKYLFTRMRGRVLNYCKRDQVIMVPDKTPLMRMGMDPPMLEEAEALNKRIAEISDEETTTELVQRLEESPSLTNLEKRIIEKRLEGKSIAEVVTELGTTYYVVQMSLKNMRNRVLRIMQGEY